MKEQLIQRALEVRQNAYVPYSHFPVGAALLGSNGEIYVGTNFENASYGLTICAERSAVGTMVANGEQMIKAVAVSSENGVTPCGACRQVLLEFADPAAPVYIISANSGEVRKTTVAQLIPDAFDQVQLANGQVQ